MSQVYAIGVDWADDKHDVCVLDEQGHRVLERSFDETPEGFSELGRLLDEWAEQGIELVACIEKPEGLVIELLIDHSVRVYPINPKSLKNARYVYRASGSRDDVFDAFVLADYIRTHYQTLRAIEPNTPEMAELKILTRDHSQQVKHRSRLLAQLRQDLKAFYPRPLEVFGDLKKSISRDFLRQCQTPGDLENLTRARWLRFVKGHRLSKDRIEELWKQLKAPQLPVPEHITRAKVMSVQTLLRELEVVLDAVDDYRRTIEHFFVRLPEAEIFRCSREGNPVLSFQASGPNSETARADGNPSDIFKPVQDQFRSRTTPEKPEHRSCCSDMPATDGFVTTPTGSHSSL